MLEQAVYAGRNHTVESSRRADRRCAARARRPRATDVARVPPRAARSRIWSPGRTAARGCGSSAERRAAIGRASARRAASSRPRSTTSSTTPAARSGPTGRRGSRAACASSCAWTPRARSRSSASRSAATRSTTTSRPARTGRCGPRRVRDETIAHVTPQGAVTLHPHRAAGVRRRRRAVDHGDHARGRRRDVARRPRRASACCGSTPGGAWTAIALRDESTARARRRISPAGSGSRRTSEVGHVDAAGTVSRLALPDGDDATDVAVAPDGSACVRARSVRAGPRRGARRPAHLHADAGAGAPRRVRPGRRAVARQRRAARARRAHRAGRSVRRDAADARA